jgi:hypothetical protein
MIRPLGKNIYLVFIRLLYKFAFQKKEYAMFLFIILLGVLTAVFSALTQVEMGRPENKTFYKQLLQKLPALLMSAILFYLIFTFRNITLLALLLGLSFIIISFIYLGILPASSKKPGLFSVHFLLISSLAALSGLAWQEALWGPFVFLALFPILKMASNTLKKFSGKSLENVNELLELSGVVNSIFIFIIGLIIASDRVRFLKKIAQWLFN